MVSALPRCSLLVLAFALALAACAPSREVAAPEAPAAAPGLDPAMLAAPLGLDPEVRTGTLANGLTYYVRRNAEPADRAELRLVVDVGSILEDEDQLGLAHFVEHMAFNGTERFPELDLVNFLEGLGMRFGPDLNAYTSFDETVYMLQVPTDSAGLLETGLEVLQEWAGAVTLSDVEIEKERGVILEEWRLGRGAGARIRDQQFPVLFAGSRYAERLPIGDPEIIRSAPPEALRRFYRDWYRPELMAVVAVGDFEPARVEALIRETFSALEGPAEPRPREAFAVPAHEATRFAIATDPEQTTTSVGVIYKEPAERDATVGGFRHRLTQRLFNRMLNARLYELSQGAEPPFVAAFVGRGGFVRPVDALFLQALVQEGGLARGLDALATEAERVRRFGFTETELEREKADLRREFEVAFNEREKTESRRLAAGLVELFLEEEPAPGAARAFELAELLLPTIALAEVDALAQELVSEANRVVLVAAPEGSEVPQEDALRAVLAAAEAKELAPYEDLLSAEPLVAAPPAPGRITGESAYENGVGLLEWTLENGARVVLRPTDFKNDEVLLSAFSPGGTSLAPDSLFRAAEAASAAANAGGVGAFSATDLGKKLAGQAVQLSPFVSEREEGLNGRASPQDLETLFQLVHLYFTAPRADSSAFEAYRQRLEAFLRNRGAQPEAVFSDTLQATLAQYHPRRMPLTPEALGRIELAEAMAFYRERFRDAGDFTFVLVGAFEPAEVAPLVERYLATLPSEGREEAPRDLGIRPPEGVVRKVVRRGIEPKARVQIVFSGELEHRPELMLPDSLLAEMDSSAVAHLAAERGAARRERFVLGALADALRIRLREELREDRGGVYGVAVNAGPDRLLGTYTLAIGFSADPERVEELTAALFDEIEHVQQEGPDAETVRKVQEADRRAQDVALRRNPHWLSALANAYRYDEPPEAYLYETDLIQALSPEALREAARRYLDRSRYVEVVLMPEEGD